MHARKIPERIRQQLLVRCEGRCEHCGALDPQAHHIKTRARTGVPDHSLRNLAALCSSCHRSVHAGKPGYERYLIHSWEDPKDDSDKHKIPGQIHPEDF